MTFYHLPVLDGFDFGLVRTLGPGLGDLLFPIGRAVVGRETMGGKVILPTMRQMKIGPYLRREKDKRTYGDVFRPRTRTEWLDWLRARNLRQQSEADKHRVAPVIRYQGMARFFHDLVGHSEVVGRYLTSVSRDTCSSIEYDIAIHIRLGDFQSVRAGGGADHGTRLPLDWYREALDEARRELGDPAAAGVLFTDDDPQVIIESLQLDGVAPQPSVNALSTLFLMSTARVLIGSCSSFSLWGQYLGNSQAYWPKGFDLGFYKPLDSNADRFI